MSEVSQKIVEAMKKKGITLERLEAVSGISERHIMAIVENDKKKLPAAPYLRGYLMKIGKILDIDGEECWQEYAKEKETLRQSGKDDKLPETAKPRKGVSPKAFFIGVGIVVLLLFVATRFFRVDNPNIRFENLEEEITETKNRIFAIRGSINPKFKLMLGEEEIILKDKGEFEKEVVLEPGFNTFVFAAKKALGKEHRFPKQIFYEEATTTEAMIPEMAPETPEVIQ